MKYTFDWKEYSKLARRVAAEGCVLLKNDHDTLPAKEGETIAVFGRTQFDYIRTGTGSGGLVNIPYEVNFYEGLKNADEVKVYEPLADVYREWLSNHPFDKGGGWAQEPTSQVEMVPTDEVVEDAAKNADLAIVFLGRLAGEDKDNTPTKGCYYLRDDEREMLEKVCKAFRRSAVLINTGNIINMKWVNELNPGAVMYVWQGGCEGGNAAADVITGKVNPCGRLTDTIALDIDDYPSNANFGDRERNFYAEDIYVGYRYFETFAKESVQYPFGYGLSYTSFEEKLALEFTDKAKVLATVTNVGFLTGKQVVQVYVEAPQGLLGKPARVLVGFEKTDDLKPGESEEIVISWPIDRMASFDDTGATGHKNSFVMEAGEYKVYAGNDVRSAELVGSFMIPDLVVLESTENALYPIREFKRLKPVAIENGYKKEYEQVTVRETPWTNRLERERMSMKEIPFTGDKGYKLKDVKEGRVSMDDFVGQLTDEEMIPMTRGEGMSSPRVTPGTCAAYGGVSDELRAYGIPAAACTDGPSGIRIDSGVMALQGPCGTCLACTFDKKAVGSLYTYLGMELLKNKIDCLLGPGMNIRRHPLNGRNFEYFSEDPLVTGEMAVAELKGMAKYNTTGCIKHFACNNQETARYSSDSVVSARALREIYLKGYEMAVREGGATHIMTTYAVLNGTHTASNFDLNTLVLRKDWGFKGLVMTDWWANMGEENDPEPNKQKTGIMLRAQNDFYAVTDRCVENSNGDDTKEALEKGIVTRAELQRTAKNIIGVVMNTPAYDRFIGDEAEFEEINAFKGRTRVADVEFAIDVDREACVDEGKLMMVKDSINMIQLNSAKVARYRMSMEVAAEGSALSQMSATISVNNTVVKVISRNGGDGEWRAEDFQLGNDMSSTRFIKIFIGQTGLKFRNIKIYLVE